MNKSYQLNLIILVVKGYKNKERTILHWCRYPSLQHKFVLNVPGHLLIGSIYWQVESFTFIYLRYLLARLSSIFEKHFSSTQFVRYRFFVLACKFLFPSVLLHHSKIYVFSLWFDHCYSKVSCCCRFNWILRRYLVEVFVLYL